MSTFGGTTIGGEHEECARSCSTFGKIGSSLSRRQFLFACAESDTLRPTARPRARSSRALIGRGLDWMGIELDDASNAAAVGIERRISAETSRVQLWVIPTDEELRIARDTWRVVTGVDRGAV